MIFENVAFLFHVNRYSAHFIRYWIIKRRAYGVEYSYNIICLRSWAVCIYTRMRKRIGIVPKSNTSSWHGGKLGSFFSSFDSLNTSKVCTIREQKLREQTRVMAYTQCGGPPFEIPLLVALFLSHSRRRVKLNRCSKLQINCDWSLGDNDDAETLIREKERVRGRKKNHEKSHCVRSSFFSRGNSSVIRKAWVRKEHLHLRITTHV